MRKDSTPWQQVAETFDRRAGEYDDWYKESLLFDIELSALQGLSTTQPAPRLEIGVGPGRFAQALNVELGLDPALAPLKISQERGIMPCRAIGEILPLRNDSIGTVFMLFTLCFLADPQKTIGECFRVIQKNGLLIVGMVPATSAWGRLLTKKKEAKHPFYRHAEFYDLATVTSWLTASGFKITETRSTLFQEPDSLTEHEDAIPELAENAGFAIIAATRL